MDLIETHTHLSDDAFDNDRADALDRAARAGVGALVEIAEHERQWAKARALAEAHPGRIFWSAGWHPYYAAEADPDLPVRMADAWRHPACVAVGEIGLDYHRPDPLPDVQREVFRKLAHAARRGGKPLVLHCRERDETAGEAQADLLRLLRELPPPDDGGPAGVAHCFQGTPEVAGDLLSLGYLIGVDAPVTYPKAGPLRALIALIPLESLVLETDSPYLPPQSHRGKRNEPAHLPSVAQALAAIKSRSLEEVARVTSANARRLFRLPRPLTKSV